MNKTSALILGLALSIVSCVHDNSAGFIIKGNVKNCGEWENGGHVVLVIRDNGKQITDTAIVRNGHFTLTGNIANPDFVFLFPAQSDQNKPMGRIVFFLENEKYHLKINDGVLSTLEIRGGTTEKLLKEMADYQKEMDEKYCIESIDRQLNTTLTPPYRMEKLKAVRHEYDSVMKEFKDSIILANTPSYFSLYMTSQAIAGGEDLDSVREVLKVYQEDDRYKDDPRLGRMIEITEGKRRP